MGQRTDIDALVRAIDEDPDPLHLDMTPAVHELGAIGVEALPALFGVLDAPNEDTRLRAQRALEAIIHRRHGFVSGRGFPSDQAEADARAELARIGYDFEGEPAARRAAIDRLRTWLGAGP